MVIDVVFWKFALSIDASVVMSTESSSEGCFCLRNDVPLPVLAVKARRIVSFTVFSKFTHFIELRFMRKLFH